MVLGYKSRLWRSGAGTVPRSNGMIYTDLRIQNTWEASRTQKGNSGVLINFVGADEGRHMDVNLQSDFSALNNKVFPGVAGMVDGNVVAWNWANFPYSRGAYSSVKTGDWSRIGKSAALAELQGRLHFAGEHATEKSGGFMNGAVYSGLRAARAVARK
jgi:monoamine oxidase